MAVAVAQKAEVQRLALFHHEPTHDDRTMEKIDKQAKAAFRASVVAQEGMEIDLL
jgi:phosphoribosyl 1,2-cyclic phosphodiesterase